MTPFAIAALQLELGAGRDNLPHIRARLSYLMAVFPWVQMVVLSELATYGPSPARAEPLPGPAERAFQEMAQRHGIWLINGSLMEMHGDHVHNTSSVIGPDGRVVARYRKIFPFLPYEQGVEPGKEFVVFDVPDVGRFGISICYDMWFPETSRTLAAMGAEVILHPVMTTTIDRETEVAMARATAAQNQCFVIDANGAGEGGNGRSIIAGPAGEVLYQAGTAEELIPLEIDFDRVRRSREFGLRGLGQPLKSFRDAKVDFTVYQPGSPARKWLESLGPVEKPARGSRAGLDRSIPWREGTPEPEPVPDRDGGSPAAAPQRIPAESAGTN